MGLQSVADDTGGQQRVPETAAQNVTSKTKKDKGKGSLGIILVICG